MASLVNMPEWITLDSSCWLEYIMDSDRANLYAAAVERPQALIVPMITVYEVYKKVLRECGASIARETVGLMRQGQLIEADLSITLAAAQLNMSLADSIIYATAQEHNATVWTQDAHFEGRAGVKYFPKLAPH
jgi:toxin FitB